MRLALTGFIILGLSAVAGAQTLGLPLPTIGLPLPQIGLPLPQTGLPPVHPGAPPRTIGRSPSSIDRHPVPNGRGARGPRGLVYFVPTFGWGAVVEPPPAQPPAGFEPKPPMGRLRLELQPGVDPQLFVDGYFVGTLTDVGGGLTIEPGAHVLELHADGYEPFVVDVQIVADTSITYRGAMTALRPMVPPVFAAPSEAAPPARATIYMIPGCYVGNLPPRDVTLPPGCDAGRVSVFPPRPWAPLALS